MIFKTKIIGIKKTNEIDDVWSDDDFRSLLKLFDFADVQDIAPNDLKEMLQLAIADFEPSEAASIFLSYKLGDKLNAGQIESISHEMLNDKVAEEYPEPELHFDLFNINQFLYKAYNGCFPNTEASVISIECYSQNEVEITEEIMTKILAGSLTEKSILKRLYEDQLNGKTLFADAAKFIWTLKDLSNNSYEITTSKYWIEKEDITSWEYEVNVIFHE